MTLTEALKIAEQANPKRPVRAPMDKLQRATAAAELSAGVTVLSKSYGVIGGTLAKVQAHLSQLRKDIDILERTAPTPIMRKLQ